MQQHIVTTWDISDHPNKEAVIDYVRENWHNLYSWGDENTDSLKAFCTHFGLTGLDYSISLASHSYARATIDDTDISELSGVRLWKYLNNNNFVNRDFLGGDCPFTGYCFDETLLDAIREFMRAPIDIDFQELMSTCLEDWVQAYIKDWEYTYTHDSIIEHLQANEYQFTESGHFYK